MEAQFKLGALVEITNAERHTLERLADEMRRPAHHGSVGWFKSYLEGHKHSKAIISDIFIRSHANS